MVVMVTSQFQGLILPLPLTFVPPVLEPDLDLCGGELQGAGEVLPLRGRQVTLLLEAPLQLEHLSLGEEDAGFSAGPLLLYSGSVRLLIPTFTRERPVDLCREGNPTVKYLCNAARLSDLLTKVTDV